MKKIIFGFTALLLAIVTSGCSTLTSSDTRLLWSHSEAEGVAYIAWEGDVIIRYDDDAEVLDAIDSTSGDILWSQPFKAYSVPRSQKAWATDASIIFPTDNSIRALDLKSGAEIFSIPQSPKYRLAATQDVVVTLERDGNGGKFLAGHDIEDGSFLWEREVDPFNQIVSAPIGTNSMIMRSSSVPTAEDTSIAWVEGNDRIEAFDVSTGESLWTESGHQLFRGRTPTAIGNLVVNYHANSEICDDIELKYLNIENSDMNPPRSLTDTGYDHKCTSFAMTDASNPAMVVRADNGRTLILGPDGVTVTPFHVQPRCTDGKTLIGFGLNDSMLFWDGDKDHEPVDVHEATLVNTCVIDDERGWISDGDTVRTFPLNNPTDLTSVPGTQLFGARAGQVLVREGPIKDYTVSLYELK